MVKFSGIPDYLVIGHVTRDLVESGFAIGGTATYAALCTAGFGNTAAILTSCAEDFSLESLNQFSIWIVPAEKTTTFENQETVSGCKQILHAIASKISPMDIPENYKQTKIVHLGPVADEVDADIVSAFPNSFIGLTPQGWMRKRDQYNIVQYKEWDRADFLLDRADAVVLSVEDVQNNEDVIQTYAGKTKILAVTEGYNGARVYWNGDVRHFSAPMIKVVDPTGAGDIFATTFFNFLHKNKDPWESGRLAVLLASASVTKVGIKGIPTLEEIRAFQIEIIEGK